jgi:hypothetical protein
MEEEQGSRLALQIVVSDNVLCVIMGVKLKRPVFSALFELKFPRHTSSTSP